MSRLPPQYLPPRARSLLCFVEQSLLVVVARKWKKFSAVAHVCRTA